MNARYRHVYLLLSLVFLLVASPLARGQALRFDLFDLLVLVTMVGGVAGVATNRLQVGIAVVLSVAMAGGMLFNRLDPSVEINPIYPALGLVFYGYLTIMLARHVFSVTPEVTTDTICGALSIYLLLGVLWTFAYAWLESSAPGSFNFPEDPGRGGLGAFQRLIGFSFITLTTLGYGNISPASHLADTLCSAEALIGQIYLTVLVARLVALHIVHRSSPSGDDAG